MRAERLILKFLVIILIRTNANAAILSGNAKSLVSQLLGRNNYSPVIVLINKHKESNVLRTNDITNNNDKSNQPVDDAVNNEKTKYYLNAILRSTGDLNDPAVRDANQRFQNALRSRCVKMTVCVQSCPKKKKSKCESRCKKDYDKKRICPPPPPPKPETCDDNSNNCDSCEAQDNCGKSGGKGKTMPPKWK